MLPAGRDLGGPAGKKRVPVYLPEEKKGKKGEKNPGSSLTRDEGRKVIVLFSKKESISFGKQQEPASSR